MTSLEREYSPEKKLPYLEPIPAPLLGEERAFIDKVACIVLAGGQGERLFPLTQTRCKPAIPFGSRYCLIDIPLSHAINAHIPSIYIISQYLADSLHDHVLKTYGMCHQGGNVQLQLLSPEETPHEKVWYEGTADAIRKNRRVFQNSSAEYFLILSGDQLYNMDLHALLLFAKNSDADLVIAALPVEAGDAGRMGLMTIDGEQNIQEFVEKPQESAVLKRFELAGQGKYLGSMGIYVFKRKALFALLGHSGSDFGKDLIPKQLALGKTVAYVYPGYWEDIGTIGSYYKASLALLKEGPCLNVYDEKNPLFSTYLKLPATRIQNTRIDNAIIGEGAVIAAKEISESVIGMCSHIGQGSVVRRSILLSGQTSSHRSLSRVGIGEGSLIEGAIIDGNSWIGNYVQLTNKRGIQRYDGEGIYVRDGIIIVAAGARIPDGFSL